MTLQIANNVKKWLIIRWIVRFLKRWLAVGHCKFEPSIPFDCISAALTLLRNKDYSKENTGLLLQHVGCTIGSVGAMLAGDHPDPQPGPEPDVTDWLFGSSVPATVVISLATDEQLEQKLQELLPSDGTMRFDWSSILNLAVPILLELLKRWLEKQQAS